MLTPIICEKSAWVSLVHSLRLFTFSSVSVVRRCAKFPPCMRVTICFTLSTSFWKSSSFVGVVDSSHPHGRGGPFPASRRSCFCRDSRHRCVPMTADDHHFRREDRAVRWQRIASHIAEHPEDLAIPLANCDRWLALGRVHPAPLREWQRLIHAAQDTPEAFHDFIQFLASPDYDAEPLRSCSPFVGLPLGESFIPLA